MKINNVNMTTRNNQVSSQNKDGSPGTKLRKHVRRNSISSNEASFDSTNGDREAVSGTGARRGDSLDEELSDITGNISPSSDETSENVPKMSTENKQSSNKGKNRPGYSENKSTKSLEKNDSKESSSSGEGSMEKVPSSEEGVEIKVEKAPDVLPDEQPPSYNELYSTSVGDREGDWLDQSDGIEDVEKNDDLQEELAQLPADRSWGEILYDFTQSTSLHGAKQITEPQPFFVRRLVWLLVFLGSTVLLLIQLSYSVGYYLSWPVSVDVKINYNNTIQFPTVTICNENAFRATVAYDNGYYGLINELFMAKAQTQRRQNKPPTNLNISDDNPMSDYSSNITTLVHNESLSLEELYSFIGHTLDDLIVSCKWEGQPCRDDDILVEMTDFGKCFTFNGNKNGVPLKVATTTGSGGGLRLQLNIEQYEYMRGPNKGAGLKILVHNWDEIPRVKDHGVAVPPGSHAFMAVKTIEVNNLEPEHGKCNDSVVLDYFPDYTVENCHVNCKEKFVLRECGCKDYYMPGDNLGVCSVSQYQNCLKKALDAFAQQKSLCDCPIPCHSLMYEPVISYAATSNFDIQALLRRNDTHLLAEKFVKARQVSQKVSKAVVAADRDLMSTFEVTTHNLSLVIGQISDYMQGLLGRIKASNGVMQRRINFHMDQGLEKMESSMENNAIRPYEAFKERNLGYVSFDYLGLPELLKDSIEDAADHLPVEERDARKLVYLPVETKLIRRFQLVKTSRSYIQDTNKGYRDRSPGGKLQIYTKKWYDKTMIIPELLDAGLKSIGKKEYFKQFKEFFTTIDTMKTGILVLMKVGENYVEDAYFNETRYDIGRDIWVENCAKFNSELYRFERLIIDIPRAIIHDVLLEFTLDNRSQSEAFQAIDRKIKFIMDKLSSSVEEQFQRAQNISDMSRQYLADLNNISKVELARIVTSEDTHELFYSLQLFFNDVRLYIADLQNELLSLHVAYENVWKSMLDNIYTKHFYEALYRDIEHFSQDNITMENHTIPIGSWKKSPFPYRVLWSGLLSGHYSKLGYDPDDVAQMSKDELIRTVNGDFHILKLQEVLAQEAEEFQAIQRILEECYDLAESDTPFIEAFESYKSSLQQYVDGNSINSEFFRENFMRLDIFLQELRYEEVTQQKAYDMIKLLSDIGGSMGLFIGASVLSIIEFLDVFLHQAAQSAYVKVARSKIKKKMKKRKEIGKMVKNEKAEDEKLENKIK